MPFRQLYEIVRVASACKIDISHFLISFKSTFESYDGLWSSLSSIAKVHGAQIPERSSLAAWDRAGSNFEGVALSGKLRLLDQQKGPCFEFQFNPLKTEPSYRLSRQFGSDRFCVLGMPGLGPEGLPSYLKRYHTVARGAIIDWLVDTSHNFLGRTWRAFFTKPDASKKKGMRNSATDSRYRIFFFAEDGVGFRDGERRGEVDPRLLDRPRKTVREMVEWFMPFKANLDQPSLKLFARLALGPIRDLLSATDTDNLSRCQQYGRNRRIFAKRDLQSRRCTSRYSEAVASQLQAVRREEKAEKCVTVPSIYHERCKTSSAPKRTASDNSRAVLECLKKPHAE